MTAMAWAAAQSGVQAPDVHDISEFWPQGSGWNLIDHRVLQRGTSNDEATLAEVVEVSESSLLFGLFSWGTNGSDAISQLRQQYQDAGSALLAYVTWEKDDSILGGLYDTKTWHIIVVHSIAPLVLAIFIAAFFLGLYGLSKLLHWTTVTQTLQSLADGLHGMIDGVLPGPVTKTIANEVILVVGAGAIISFGVWYLSANITKHETGAFVLPPAAPAIHSPALNVSRELDVGVTKGPVRVGVRQGAEARSQGPGPGGTVSLYRPQGVRARAAQAEAESTPVFARGGALRRAA